MDMSQEDKATKGIYTIHDTNANQQHSNTFQLERGRELPLGEFIQRPLLLGYIFYFFMCETCNLHLAILPSVCPCSCMSLSPHVHARHRRSWARCVWPSRAERSPAPTCSASTPHCTCRWTRRSPPGYVRSATRRRPMSTSSSTGRTHTRHPPRFLTAKHTHAPLLMPYCAFTPKAHKEESALSTPPKSLMSLLSPFRMFVLASKFEGPARHTHTR